nr:ATP-dependent DNA helicase PIF1-like [Tanacetum cinerariifolium]
MWYEERSNKAKRATNPTFSIFYQEGKVRLSKFHEAPPPLNRLLDYTDPTTVKFREKIRVYNSMFCFTSFGARIDHSINIGRAPYTFRINGQNYHRIGSLLPKEGIQPRYAQLYFFDTENEVQNRMSTFTDKESLEGLDPNIVQRLIEMLNQSSFVAKVFQMAINWSHTHGSNNMQLKLLGEKMKAMQYNKPTVAEWPKANLRIAPKLDGTSISIAFTAVEEQRLKWSRNNQDTLRADLYHNVCDAVTKGVQMQKGSGKEYTPAQIDDIISTEIPSQLEDPKGYKVVIEFVLHGPCGKDAKHALCNIEEKCSKHFPKSFNEETIINADGYPIYRRRDNKLSAMKGKFNMKDFFSFDIHYSYSSVMKLNFHLPNQHMVNLRDSDHLPALLQREGINATTFTDWFELNKRDPAARTLTYAEIPKHYVWHEKLKLWKQRKQQKYIGKIVYSSPSSGERYYLRMLLNVLRGAQEFTELITVNKRIYPTFKETCFAYGLLNDDKEWTHAISEASFWALGPQLRDLFVTILIFCDNTHLAELMQQVQLIIWDEAPMTQKYAFEALDKTLRDILGYKNPQKRNQLFGGLTVLLGGDFRQILLVIPKGKRSDIVQSCINRSQLWKYCKVITLTQSMRVNENYENGEIDTQKQDFNQWVLAVGMIVQETYPDFTTRQHDDDYLKERAILTPRNDDPDAINAYMFKKLAGDTVTYNSADEICKASTNTLEQYNLYPIEFLNSLNFPGMPPHSLCL